ncbi:MAG: hypothetical protein ABIR30_14255 [Chitinophagaceae bacterium]
MSDSNCNCCCQYSTPPWWVTMGFVPPANNYTGHVPGAVVVGPPVTAGTNTGVRPGTGVKNPGGFAPGTSAGNVLGNTGSAIGNAAGTILETPLNLAGGILSDVVTGVGGLFGKIF